MRVCVCVCVLGSGGHLDKDEEKYSPQREFHGQKLGARRGRSTKER